MIVKTMYKIIISGLSIGLLIACSTSKPNSLDGITQSDLDRGVTKYPDLTLQQLNDGKMIYQQYCGNCHSLKSPASESENGWKHHVPEMVELTNKKAGREEIDVKEKKLILKYVITMSSK